MPCTLLETLRQIDPYVLLSDGRTISTVQQRLWAADPHDTTEYTIGVDFVGRLLIYRLNHRGVLCDPPAYTEVKSLPPDTAVKPLRRETDFGHSVPGYV